MQELQKPIIVENWIADMGVVKTDDGRFVASTQQHSTNLPIEEQHNRARLIALVPLILETLQAVAVGTSAKSFEIQKRAENLEGLIIQLNEICLNVLDLCRPTAGMGGGRCMSYWRMHDMETAVIVDLDGKAVADFNTNSRSEEENINNAVLTMRLHNNISGMTDQEKIDLLFNVLGINHGVMAAKRIEVVFEFDEYGMLNSQPARI